YENTLSSARDRLQMYEDLAKREQAVVAGGGTVMSNGERVLPEEAELRRAEEMLAALLARYSDSHPDVRRVRSQIEVLTNRVAALKASAPTEPEPELAANPTDPA